MTDRIFTLIWRANGLLILLVTLLSLGIMASNFLDDIFTTDYVSSVTTTIADDPDGKENWVLGVPDDISGHPASIIPLVSEHGEIEATTFDMFSTEGFSGTISGRHSKNILFVNRQTGESHWLFNGVNQLINDTQQLPHHNYFWGEKRKPTELILYMINIKDTNNDGVVSNDDSEALALSKPDGDHFEIILEDYEKILSTSLEADGHLSVMYQKSGLGRFARFTLNPVTLVSDLAFPEL